MERLIPLGDDRCRDPRFSGHKAAELGRAAAAEMPVLPGWVLPLGESAAALRAGASAARGGSPAAGVLAVSAIELDDDLRSELGAAVRSLGGSVVVRSSSPLEEDPRWSGAFATYLDVGEHEVDAAVRGCWASASTRDARARGELLGVDPAEPGLAVLIQPWVAFEAGGVATIERGGSIRLAFAPGSPADLLAGRARGVSIRLAPDGTVSDVPVPAGLDASTARAVAGLARDVHAILGADSIEWGLSSTGGVTLLQARRSAPHDRTSSLAASAPRRRTYPPVAARLSTAAARYPGPLAGCWVLPWALAIDGLPPAARIEVADPIASMREAANLAAELAALVWEVPRGRVDAEVASSFRRVLGPDPSTELARLSAFGPPGLADAARLLGLIEGIGLRLQATGAISDAGDVWRLSPDELSRVTRGLPVAVRRGADRWEPFVFSVARDRGRMLVGRSASPGVGAGRPVAIDVGVEAMPPPRRVLVVPAAVPQLAPFLWGAAGLVAGSGSEGAHLFEVARSLGVPAVIGVELGPSADGVVAVDGDAGTVSELSTGAGGRLSNPRFSLERRTG